MNEETIGLQVRSFMAPIYPVIVPAAITALVAPCFLSLYERYQGRHDALYLPVSNAPDQPHPPENNGAPKGTTTVEWSISGTNTSAVLATTTWTSTTLIMPFDSDPFVVSRLRQVGLTVAVSLFQGS
jgi:hypothetical protein